MGERSRRRVHDLVTQRAFEGRSQNETERARISIMARSDLDRSIRVPDRRYGIRESVEAPFRLSHHERLRRLCSHRSGRG